MVPGGPTGGKMEKEYIGDGAYVEFDGYALILTTENGIEVTNTIYLEPDVLDKLNRYADKIRKKPGEKV